MVILALLRMEEEVSVGTQRDTLSITPATWDTSCQEVLREHVSLMECGQEVQLLAQVSVMLIKRVIHAMQVTTSAS